MRLFLLLIIIASCLHLTAADFEDGDRHPVLLFPGLACSQIDAKVNKSDDAIMPHFFCRRHRDWFRLWLDPAYILPSVIDCFFENMKLVYNEETGRTRNADGVETRIVGFGQTESIEYLTTAYGVSRFRASRCFFVLDVMQ